MRDRLAVIGVLAWALAAAAGGATAQGPGTAGSPRPPPAGEAAPAAGGGAVPDAPANGAAPQTAPGVWPAEEIVRGRALCAHVLMGVDAVVMPLDPIREGDCGAPAPVKVLTIGRNPEVVLAPPPTLTCGMVAALAAWLEHDVQPLAKQHLGAAVARIETMSSYSCRNAYGRTRTRLSEHGRANALDIRGFGTTRGAAASLLEGWGPTARDIRARELAAAAEAEAKAAAAAAGSRAANPAGEAAAGSRALPPSEAKPADSPAAAGEKGSAAATRPPAERERLHGSLTAIDPPSRLNGPEPGNAAGATAPAALDERGRFLRAVHGAACRRFGTVLGPEANDAHRNHLHLDMAERSASSYCE